MTTQKMNPMRALYERLSEAGVSRSFLKRRVLPDWWDDRIGQNRAGYLQALGYVSKHLGLDVESLRDMSIPLELSHAAGARFKLRDGVNHDDVTWPRQIGIRAAELATLATSQPYISVEAETASSLRERILDRGAPWVGLDHLIDLCWEFGIPVVHVSRFPQGAKKMTGMAVVARNRPAIVLTSNKKHAAWLLFDLAHELGHIVHGHVHDDEVWVDDKIDFSATQVEEREANEFAVELLTGSPETQVEAASWPPAVELAQKAMQIGREESIDPGALILNFAYHDSGNIWKLANAGLNRLDPNPNAPEIIRSLLKENLDWDRLPEESAAYLHRITAIDCPAICS